MVTVSTFVRGLCQNCPTSHFMHRNATAVYIDFCHILHVGSELSRISRLSHDSVLQLRAVLVLRDLHQFVDNAPARSQSDQVEGDKRALAIVTLAVDERLQPTAAAASNTMTALKSLHAATQGSLFGVDSAVKLRQGAKENLASCCQRAEALEQQLLGMQQIGMQPMP
jgi:hypothetical protein